VATLGELLRYFDRGDIQEVRLQSGAPIVVSQNGRSRPLTSEPLSPDQLTTVIAGTPIEAIMPTSDTSGSPRPLVVDGRNLVVTVARHGGLVQLRFRPADGAAGGVGAKSTARPAAASQPAPRTESAQPAARSASTAKSQPRAEARSSAAPQRPAARSASTDRAAAAPRAAGSVAGDLPGLLRLARELDASDLHVVSDRPCSIRVAGQLTPHGQAIGDQAVRQMLQEMMPAHKAEQLDTLGYCDFATQVEGAGRFRVNVSRQRTGLKGCFRLIAPKPKTLEELGLPSELAKVTSYHQGLAVLAGPSGQGKTTSMAALVDLVNSNKAIHIITVEDPVEVLHPIKKAVLSQREVGLHTKSFANALKASLREDPDVIVIGELRDRETVEIALSAAETGHLVIATMSTPSGAKTIARLIDMFPPDDQAQVRATLAGALKIVVSQRLIPCVDGKSQAAAAELITGNVPLWSLIRDNKLFQLPSLLQRGRAYGMIRIEDSLSTLLEAGKISEEVAVQYADDPRALRANQQAPSEPASDQVKKRGGLRNLFGKGS
jgi:twitching motility protein PilT